MIAKPYYKVVRISDDYLAVPVGNAADSIHGIIALSETAAFVLNKMEKPITREELIEVLLSEYDVERETVESDLDSILRTFLELELIEP